MSGKKHFKSFTFIDLFAGIGGFHLALEKLGGKCVFASEIQPELQKLYEKNFEMPCFGDITQLKNEDDILKTIPRHNVLCGGFPCQPFSKAGKQQGFNDEQDRGNLFDYIMKIVDARKPEYVFLENVPNLESHDEGRTWQIIHDRLSVLYDVKSAILSPHYFGIPQHRTRFYIVCRLKERGDLSQFEFPQRENVECNIDSIINPNDKKYLPLRPITRIHLRAWQHFLNLCYDNHIEIPRFPIWAMEWGADYDFEGLAPINQEEEDLDGKHGKFGQLIEGNCFDAKLQCLPIYAQTEKTTEDGSFPDWKKEYIRQNRNFYETHREILDQWLPEIQQEGFENSHQKFEWNCGNTDERPNLYTKIIQFRPSGIRAKLPTFSPALVLTTTQIPIFPWIMPPDSNEPGRYMTIKEGAKLQCLQGLRNYPKTISRAFRAFGNAVNAKVVRKIAENFLEEEK